MAGLKLRSMKNILAFAGSSSNVSMSGQGWEKNEGFDTLVQKRYESNKKADAIMISANKHNCWQNASFRNMKDWLSGLDWNFFSIKKVFVRDTFLDQNGGINALGYSKEVLSQFGVEIVQSFSLPSLQYDFSVEEGVIVDKDLALKLQEMLHSFSHQIQYAVA